jgi:hypothetical protein
VWVAGFNAPAEIEVSEDESHCLLRVGGSETMGLAWSEVNWLCGGGRGIHAGRLLGFICKWLARRADFLCDISRNPGSDEYDRSFLYPGVLPSSSMRKLVAVNLVAELVA